MAHQIQVIDQNGETAADICVSGDLSAFYAELEDVSDNGSNGEGTAVLSRSETLDLVARLPYEPKSNDGTHIVSRELSEMLQENSSYLFTFICS